MIIRFLITVLVFSLVNSAYAQDRRVPDSFSQLKLSFAPVVKQVAPAVVNIYTKRTVSRSVMNPFFSDPFFSQFFGSDFGGGQRRRQVENSLGSGVILDSGGLVVTNSHVIRGAEEITVVLADGREFDARLALADEPSDLALLRIEPKGEPLPFVSLTPSEGLQVGDLVLAIGNPFGVGQTVTSGIVSAQGRSSLGINDFSFFIQTDAAINPGNSGGALVTLDGKVVGINTAIYSAGGGSLGIGFAIPSEMVATVIAAEKAGRTGENGVVRPWLGVTAQFVTADIAESLDLLRPAGALVVGLHPASPLKKAGIEVGDVVLMMNGHDIRDPSEMKFRMATVPVGQTAQVQVMQKGSGGKISSFKIVAIAPPDDPPRQETVLEGAHPLNGMTIANLNPAVAVELGMPGEEIGVVVMKVSPNSRLGRLVGRGDILLNINGAEIKDVRDVERAVEKPAEQGFSLVISRNGRRQQIVTR